MKRTKAAILWRLLQGCAASLVIPILIRPLGVPYNYHGCEACLAMWPSWMCVIECWFG